MSVALLERMAWVFAISALGCVLVGGWAIRQLAGLRWVQPLRYDDCPPLQDYQQNKRNTPTMGGLFVLGVATAVAALWGGFAVPEGWIVFAAMGGVALIGLVDDVLKLRHPNATGLRCRPKLLAALGCGAAVGWMLQALSVDYRFIAIPWWSQRVALGWWWIPYAALVVAGSAHAVNLTDGMDGLAAGCAGVAFGTIGLLAAASWGVLASGQQAVVVWCAALAGGCMGFLWFNGFPASVFLGDVGALGLGTALGVLALLANSAVALVLVGGVFVAEALSVLLQVASYRWRNHRRIFRVAPLHHHFHLGGVSEHKLVVRFWIVGLVLAALGLTTLRHAS